MRRSSGFSLLLVLLLASDARAADARMNFLLRQLEKAKDPRARAQAALMLGAAGESGGIEPLCRAVADPEAVVRAAAVKALARLPSPRSEACIASRAKDPDADVRGAVASARGTPDVQPAVSKRPSLYIHLGPIADRTGGKEGPVGTLAERELRNALAAKGALFAPPDESKKQATTVLQQKKLQGFYLMANLDPLPSGGLKLTLVCFTYPARALLGEVNVKAMGARAPDLIRALVPRAVQDAAETFEWGSSP